VAASVGLQRVLILAPSRTYLSASDMRDLLIKLAILIAREIEKSLFLLAKSRPDGGGTHHEAAWKDRHMQRSVFLLLKINIPVRHKL
jgi:hypothetical protein